jgi:hypothetical protein
VWLCLWLSCEAVLEGVRFGLLCLSGIDVDVV